VFDLSQIKQHVEGIGADGIHVGTVDQIHGNRLKLKEDDSADHRHHYVSAGPIAEIDGGIVRLSANADLAVTLEGPGSEIVDRTGRSGGGFRLEIAVSLGAP